MGLSSDAKGRWRGGVQNLDAHIGLHRGIWMYMHYKGRQGGGAHGCRRASWWGPAADGSANCAVRGSWAWG